MKLLARGRWAAWVAALFCVFEMTPAAQSFNAQIQAALTALGYVTSTSQFVQNAKGILYPASQYINFGGVTYGSGGYGFRDNAGTMQFRNNAGTWVSIPATGGPNANAKFILQTADGTMPNAQALSALATGLVLNTTGTGVLSSSLLVPATNFPALTGDVTTPGGSLATTIAAAAVTLAKIQNATANSRVLCAGSAGSGASYTECTLGAGLSATGTVLSSTAASVAGANTQIQYNNAGAFGASASFTWTQGSTLLTVTGTTNSSLLLVGNNSPSLSSPKNAAFALNHSWTGALAAASDDGATVVTTWNTSANASGQSESVLIDGSIQGTHAMTGDLYGLHVNMDDLSTGTITKVEASRNESTVENTATVTNLYGVTSAEKIAAGGTSTSLREFYAYTPNVAGTLVTEGSEYFGDDPLGNGCTKCVSAYLYWGSRGSLVVAPTNASANASGHTPANLLVGVTSTANADWVSSFNSVALVQANFTPSADFSLAAMQALAGNWTITAAHNVSISITGSGGDVNIASGGGNFTESGTGLVGLTGELDYFGAGTAAEASAISTFFGSGGGGVIAKGQSIWVEAPYNTSTVVTNYNGITIDNQTWPGSTTNNAILYNAPGGKTFAVLANGNVELAGVAYTFPAADGSSGYVLTTNGSKVLSWSSGVPVPLFVAAGTNAAPSYSWTTAHGVGIYEPTTNQMGLVGGIILGKNTSAAKGSELYISGSGIAPAAAILEQLDLEPGLDTLQTLVVGQNGYGLYLNPVFSSSAAGTNALIADAYFDVGTWTNGGATITEASTVYIAGAPTIGASKYALHVAAGLSKFDGGVLLKPIAFASLPASPVSGMVFAISDSNTVTWGATAAGGGASYAVVTYDGANWTVMGK